MKSIAILFLLFATTIAFAQKQDTTEVKKPTPILENSIPTKPTPVAKDTIPAVRTTATPKIIYY